MFDTLMSSLVTMAPMVFAAVLNMIFCKSNICKKLNVPIDGGKKLKDGKRIFGDHKTCKGFVGYIVSSMITTPLWGVVGEHSSAINQYNYIYVYHDNTLLYSMVVGMFIGLAYALFELPNSFVKRRFDIKPGQSDTRSKIRKYVFIIYDQCDSVIGCVLVVWVVYPLGIINFLLFVLIGLLVHLFFNMLLYICKIRKTMV